MIHMMAYWVMGVGAKAFLHLDHLSVGSLHMGRDNVFIYWLSDHSTPLENASRKIVGAWSLDLHTYEDTDDEFMHDLFPTLLPAVSIRIKTERG